MCVCACMCARTRVCVHACLRVHASVDKAPRVNIQHFDCQFVLALCLPKYMHCRYGTIFSHEQFCKEQVKLTRNVHFEHFAHLRMHDQLNSTLMITEILHTNKKHFGKGISHLSQGYITPILGNKMGQAYTQCIADTISITQFVTISTSSLSMRCVLRPLLTITASPTHKKLFGKHVFGHFAFYYKTGQSLSGQTFRESKHSLSFTSVLEAGIQWAQSTHWCSHR